MTTNLDELLKECATTNRGTVVFVNPYGEPNREIMPVGEWAERFLDYPAQQATENMITWLQVNE